MYSNLNLSIPLDFVVSETTRKAFVFGDNTKVIKSLTYKNLDENYVRKIDSMMPIKPKFIEYCLIKGESTVPHIDHDCGCKLNFYIKTSGESTIFFESRLGGPTAYNGEEKANIFSLKDNRLKRIGEFVAKDGESYLLNTSLIHSVHGKGLFERTMVSISFEEPYSQVLESFLAM